MSSDSGERPGFQELVERYRHLRGEHRLSGVEGTARRHLERDLAELESRIERRLALWVPDEEERRQWRAHLHHGGPAPSLPSAPRRSSSTGWPTTGASSRYACRAPGSTACPSTAPRADRFRRCRLSLSPEGLHLAGMRCRETFTASPDSLAALRRHVSVGAGEPGSTPRTCYATA